MDRLTLILALSKYRGAVLDEATAVALVRDLYPHMPIDIAGFAPEQVGDYTIACERFADILPELHALHELHWQETEKYRHGLAMDPNYPAMSERERCGHLLQVTVRKDGELVGQVRMYPARCLHTQQLVAEEDTLFLHPQHRGGPVAIRMLRFAERCLIALGVREIRANSKLSNGADVLMRRMRYEPVAIQFSKLFPQECAQDAVRTLP